MNIEKIKKLFEECPDKRSAAKDMGTTYQNMYNLINKGSICKVDLIERIARYFNKPVGYFFDENDNQSLQNNDELAFYKKENQKLNDLLNKRATTKVVIELDVDSDEFVKMGLKEKLIRVLHR